MLSRAENNHRSATAISFYDKSSGRICAKSTNKQAAILEISRVAACLLVEIRAGLNSGFDVMLAVVANVINLVLYHVYGFAYFLLNLIGFI